MTDRIAAPRPVPSFADRMALDERDQLDARAATAEQERDEALDDLRKLQAHTTDLHNRLTTTEANLREQLDRAIAGRQQLQEDLDATVTECDRLAGELRQARAERDRVCEVANFRQGVIDRHRAELGAAGNLINVVRDAGELIDRALAAYDTVGVPTADPGSAERRAQDDFARGYAEAVAHLRDDSRYMDWWTSVGARPDGRLRHHLADYLETIGPDGPDVTKAIPPAPVPSRRAQEEPTGSRSETDVPDWVLILIRGLAKYEAEHPKLYRHMGIDQVEPYPCPCSLLEGVPAAVRERATP